VKSILYAIGGVVSAVASLIFLSQLHLALAGTVALAFLATGWYLAFNEFAHVSIPAEDIADAHAELDEELTRKPDNVSALAKRAALKFRMDDAEGALADYNAALDTNPIRADRWSFIQGLEATLYTERGQVYFSLEQFKHALHDFETAYESQPHFHPALAWLAIAHYARRHFEESHIWWNAALKHDPRYRALDGTNWVSPQPGWLEREIIPAQTITALLNASGHARANP
jgi:tetratricopeptide (TPR) repeat protein